ncbi:DUF742 domain-containing protein [Streptomyces sp. NPDC001339]|uniref:DUF742 domain-containing protein n=1 Tax=Streptomyces sp. NPDC001339 TaxID=3364563 RepID=UPI003674ED5D
MSGQGGRAARERAAARWYDDEAGPVVRPYAMTRGRTRTGAAGRLDLIAQVVAESRTPRAADDGTLAPEHLEIVERCRRAPVSVAELAAGLDLPVGVVRVLIGDLLDADLVRVGRPVPPAELPDAEVLREVIDGLRAL